jgi:cystathionine beta-lyase/cystathionine gamma-synthase
VSSRRTRVIAAAEPAPAAQVPVALPIVQTATFVYDDALTAAMAAGDYRSQYLYTRHSNPTFDALQQRLAELHGADDGVCFASGMAAIASALVPLTRERRTIVADTVLYGAATTLLTHYLADMGRRVVFFDLGDPDARATAAAQDDVGVVYCETLSNPLVRPLDLPAAVQVARAAGAHLVVDNTFANPLVCRPLEHGADLVVESLTKSISGHSDVHGGLVAGSRELVGPVWHAMVHLGGCLDPHAAYLIWRGLKTLALRTDASQQNARAVAAALRTVASVEHVYFDETPRPWLHGTGSMLAFVVRGGDAAAQRVLDSLRIVTAATSLGGVESLASLPHNTSHRTEQARRLVGLRPGTVRLSVGCEDVADLIADLSRAIAAAAEATD